MPSMKKSLPETAPDADPKRVTKTVKSRAVAGSTPSVAVKRAVEKKAEAEVPMAAKVVASAAEQKASRKKLVPGAPEAKKAGSGKRQRLSKAFSRPLDKNFKPAKPVRDRFALPEVEYAALTALKKRLADLGVKVKKSEIVRAGLALVAVLDDENLQALLAKVPPAD